MTKKVEALTAELQEQARLNGMGAEREAKLLAQIERMKKELAQAKKGIVPVLCCDGHEPIGYWGTLESCPLCKTKKFLAGKQEQLERVAQ